MEREGGLRRGEEGFAEFLMHSSSTADNRGPLKVISKECRLQILSRHRLSWYTVHEAYVCWSWCIWCIWRFRRVKSAEWTRHATSCRNLQPLNSVSILVSTTFSGPGKSGDK